MNTFHLDIVTPDGEAFSGEVESLLIRTDGGDTEILAGHADYVAPVGTGRARIRMGGVSRFASASHGIITVVGGDVKLAAVTFEFAEDIDVERAKRAKEAAEEKIRVAKDDRALMLARAKLERAIARIRASELKM
ncbi:MAG: ATP synthase F1 subunit epsilon [Clostridia bacterium]|nr:ATP synthase F1 subunit epsilon [Clostridia bacterium]